MKVPKFKSRKLPAWELRTPKWRKQHAQKYKGIKVDKDLAVVIRQCKPGDSFVTMKYTSQAVIQRTAILCGTWAISRQTTVQGKKVQRIWIVYPCLTDTQLFDRSPLLDDTAGPCVPDWKFPAGIISYKSSELYDDVLKQKGLTPQQ